MEQGQQEENLIFVVPAEDEANSSGEDLPVEGEEENSVHAVANEENAAMEDTDEEDNIGYIDADDEISSGELFPIEHAPAGFDGFNYDDPLSYSGIIRAIISDDLEKVEQLVADGRSVRIVDNHGNTPLHVAVIRSTEEKVNIVKYLLSLEEVDKNATNHYGHTPLFLSALEVKETAAFLLLGAGADPQIASHEDVTPLHISVRSSVKISEALILAGADIDYVDYTGDTPLHDAINFGDTEAICLLLYYNADTSIRNSGDLTPFMRCLIMGKCHHADELFEYVSDFNQVTKDCTSTLFHAINAQYSRTINMIERGADVNYLNGIFNVFTLEAPPSLELFKCMWNIFDYEHIWARCWPNILIYILNDPDTDRSYKLEAFKIILEDNFSKTKYLVEDSFKYPLIHPFVSKLCRLHASYEDVYTFCVILLSFNLKVYDIDLDVVYEKFGYSELFKLLLHMDITESGLKRTTFFPRMIYELKNYNTTSTFLPNQSFWFTLDYDHLLEHTASLPLKYKLQSYDEKFPPFRGLLGYMKAFPQMPKLIELARNATRDYLCKRFKIKNCMQFYTMLKHLYIPESLKKLIAFETPIYGDCLTPKHFEHRQLMKQVREKESVIFDKAFYNVLPFSTRPPKMLREE